MPPALRPTAWQPISGKQPRLDVTRILVTSPSSSGDRIHPRLTESCLLVLISCGSATGSSVDRHPLSLTYSTSQGPSPRDRPILYTASWYSYTTPLHSFQTSYSTRRLRLPTAASSHFLFLAPSPFLLFGALYIARVSLVLVQ